MKNRFIFSGILALSLVFVFGFISCEEDTPDTWSAVTSLSQLNGSWSGSISETVSSKDSADESMKKLDIKAIQAVIIDIIIKASEKKQNYTNSFKMSISGKDAKIMWDFYFKDEDGNYPENRTETNENITNSWTFDHKNYLYIAKTTITNSPINDEYIEDFEINQNGKKIRQLRREDEETGKKTYLVFYKK